jgi:hypothetical protein
VGHGRCSFDGARHTPFTVVTHFENEKTTILRNLKRKI